MPKEKRIEFEIRKVNNLIKREIESSKTFQETTGLHGWAIGWLYENRNRQIFQRDFEERFSIRRSTASNILALMEKNGLIKRESVESDARLKRITLTQKAIDIHRQVEREISDREARIIKGINSADLDTFFKVINAIKGNLGEDND